MRIEFPLLKANDIEVRVQSVKEGSGVSLLLYKTARVDANILDNHEDIGCFNWEKRFYELKGNIYCSLSIYDNDRNEWVSKDDCGKESETESEKGEASDAFKRAGFAWGIGRELYTAPFIWVKDNTITKQSAKALRFSVKSISYTDTKPYEIKSLEIVDNNGVLVYSYGTKNKPQPQPQPQPSAYEPLPSNCIPCRNEELLTNVITRFNLLDSDKQERWLDCCARKGWGRDLTKMNDEMIGVLDKALPK